MSIWIITSIICFIYALVSLPGDIRDKDTLQTNLDIALIVLGAMALTMYLATER